MQPFRVPTDRESKDHYPIKEKYNKKRVNQHYDIVLSPIIAIIINKGR